MNILGIETAKLPSPSAQGAIPILVLLVLVMMLVPLPAVLLDVLFTFNIALSIIVLFTAINIKTFKDFVAFPTVLLLTTLLRLSLNVASTRVVLMEGHQGTDAAGRVFDTHRRYVYIHGTNQTDKLGQPNSHGCVLLADQDVIRLYGLVPAGTPVLIRA